ncbi:MAG: helix-hairpin-helix domain-containing protein [Bacteroidota bacterium]
MRNLARFLYEYFYYTRAERNASIVLAILCMVFFLLPGFYSYLTPPSPRTDFSELRAMAMEMIPEKATAEKSAERAPNFRNENFPATSTELFKFDPNNVNKEELIKLGLSSRTAQTMLNYRMKGGRFFKKEDLKKVYGLRAEDYERLEKWVVIASRPSSSSKKANVATASSATGQRAEKNQQQTAVIPAKKSFAKKVYAPVPIDINQSTAEDWQQFRGIGPGYSNRIVKFRDKLGGFASVEQVGETYGLPDSTFQAIQPYLTVSPVLQKIAVNTCSLEELKSHPYLSNYQATILFNYRKQHGPLAGMEELKKIKAGFKESDWARLGVYFSFE